MKNSYSSVHLAEEYRYQSFKSRAFHHIDSKPESRIEWQEIMQHHGVKTRLMDWSESAISALLFALESYIRPENDYNLKHSRANAEPVIWVLLPYHLNTLVFETIISGENEGYPFIRAVVDDVEQNRSKADRLACFLGSELSKNKTKYFSYFNSNSNGCNIDGLIGLSVIDTYRQENIGRLCTMLNNLEFNPLFYVMARYYADGICTPISETMQLPPLAIIHPYHSERIKAQHGAFTVFPYYRSPQNNNSLSIQEYKSIGTDLRAMENQLRIRECLYKIRLCNANKIAEELRRIGEKHTSLYPELERYAKDIEA